MSLCLGMENADCSVILSILADGTFLTPLLLFQVRQNLILCATSKIVRDRDRKNGRERDRDRENERDRDKRKEILSV